MDLTREDLLKVLPLDEAVAVIGSANADLVVGVEEMPTPGETIAGGPLEVLPGGKSSNQAVASALLGAPTSFIGAVGADGNGSLLESSMSAAGVNIDHLKRVDRPTSCAVITVDSHAENMIVVTSGANETVDVEMLEAAKAAIESAKVLGLALEIPLETVVKAAEIAQAANVITVVNPSPLPDEIPDALLAATDVLVVNEGEMQAIAGDFSGDWAEAERRVHRLGVKRAIVTLGPRGAFVLENGATHVSTIDVDVVDTTGCGDSFTGSVMAALAAGSNLVDAARFASIVASYASAGKGAQRSYGNIAEIDAALFPDEE